MNKKQAKKMLETVRSLNKQIANYYDKNKPFEYTADFIHLCDSLDSLLCMFESKIKDNISKS